MLPSLLALGLTVGSIVVAFEEHLVDDSFRTGDLHTFISRPDLKPQIYHVKVHKPDNVAPGYYFVAPYDTLAPFTWEPILFTPGQNGPAIYDENGDLVWSGARMMNNSRAFSFQNNCDSRGCQMSFLTGNFETLRADAKGQGIILSPSLEVVEEISTPSFSNLMNNHELQLISESDHAIYALKQKAIGDMTIPPGRAASLWYWSDGFNEVNYKTGEVVFSWVTADHVDFAETLRRIPDYLNGPDSAFDPFHLNSVDKDPRNGNYLVSLRHTGNIVYVSGEDGAILWRMGGKQNNFDFFGLDGQLWKSKTPIFSWQHDARFHFCENEPNLYPCRRGLVESGEFLISLMNNNGRKLGDYRSNALLLKVNTNVSPMTARVVEQHYRPDNLPTDRCGNAQYLPNGNLHASWHDWSYMTEHGVDDNGTSYLIKEFRQLGDRLRTYRGFKFEFQGAPSEPIAMVSQVYGTQNDSMTVFHVSWNGAIDVVKWRFKVAEGNETDTEKFKTVGEVNKSGFETELTVRGWWSQIYVEAVNKTGQVVGQSQPIKPKFPRSWGAEYLSIDKYFPQTNFNWTTYNYESHQVPNISPPSSNTSTAQTSTTKKSQAISSIVSSSNSAMSLTIVSQISDCFHSTTSMFVIPLVWFVLGIFVFFWHRHRSSSWAQQYTQLYPDMEQPVPRQER